MTQQPGLTLYEGLNDENRVLISEAMANRCLSYSEERQKKDAAWYAKVRGGYPPTVNDLWNYKAAECAVSQFMPRFGFPLVEPDFNIYERGKKNWDSDLTYKDVSFMGESHSKFDLGVKSFGRASASRGFPPSFLFQASDEVFKCGGKNNWYAFVHVPHLKPVAKGADFYIYCLVNFDYLQKNHLFGETVKKNFKEPKYAVYMEQLERVAKRLPIAI